MKISSSAFAHQTTIPAKYTCDGQDVNPPLLIEKIPREAESLVIVCEDPDAGPQPWVHWVVFAIPVIGDTFVVRENSTPGEEAYNDFGKKHYGGPCPPSGEHRYFFKAFALKRALHIEGGTPQTLDKEFIEKCMKGYVVATAEMVGLYKRSA